VLERVRLSVTYAHVGSTDKSRTISDAASQSPTRLWVQLAFVKVRFSCYTNPPRACGFNA